MPDRTCSIDGCENPRYVRGWCNKHYLRWWTHGDPLFVLRKRETLEARAHFDEHVMEPSEGCRLWPYSQSNGYPSIDGTRIHVRTCEMWHGPRPEGMEAAHSCGIKLCWAGEHLRWATKAENSQDRIKHGTTNRGEQNVKAKLTSSQVLAIRERRAAGEGSADLALEYGVAPDTIRAITNRRTWKHL